MAFRDVIDSSSAQRVSLNVFMRGADDFVLEQRVGVGGSGLSHPNFTQSWLMEMVAVAKWSVGSSGSASISRLVSEYLIVQGMAYLV